MTWILVAFAGGLTFGGLVVLAWYVVGRHWRVPEEWDFPEPPIVQGDRFGRTFGEEIARCSSGFPGMKDWDR